MLKAHFVLRMYTVIAHLLIKWLNDFLKSELCIIHTFLITIDIPDLESDWTAFIIYNWKKQY